MKTFEYEGFNAAGRKCRGLVEALGPKEAREKLAREGVLVDRLLTASRKTRFDVNLRSTLYWELSSLLGAGLPLVKALDMLIESPELSNIRTMLAGVRDRVRDGMPLADALTGASAAVTPFEQAIIQAAERSATVDVMLERLAEFLDEQERLRSRVQGALVYPTLVFCMGVCVGILMLGLLVPKAAEILKQNNGELPALTAFMTGLSSFIIRWGWSVLLAGVGGWLILRERLRKPGFRRELDRRLFTFPVLGRGYTILANLRFARTFAILVRGGVSAMESMVMAGRATGSEWISHLAEREAESVRNGSRISDAVRRIPPLSAHLPGWIQTGEAGGGLDKLMDRAGSKFQANWEDYVNRCLTLLEPVLIGLVGGFVLLIALSVLLPILSMSTSLGR